MLKEEGSTRLAEPLIPSAPPPSIRDVPQSLYEVLGVKRDASQESIRRAYKLKAMELLPERETEEAQFSAMDQYLAVRYAYDVLSDTKKRSLYDRGGETAIEALEQASALLPSDWASTAAELYTCGTPLFLFMILFSNLFILSVPILWCFRLDGLVDWDYAAVMFPLWLLDIALFVSLGNRYFVPPAGLESQALVQVWAGYRPFMYVFFVLKLLAFIAFQVMIVLQLDGFILVKATEVFVPWFAYEGLTLLEVAMMVILGWKLRLEYERERMFDSSAHFSEEQSLLAGELEEEVLLCIRENLNGKAEAMLQRAVVRIAFAVLLSLKIDGILMLNWGFVFIPVWLELGTQLIMLLSDAAFLLKLRPVVKFSPNERESVEHRGMTAGYHELREKEDENEVEAPSLLSLFLRVLMVSAMLSTFIIICFLLEYPGSFSTFHILLPGAILLFGLSLWICYTRLRSSRPMLAKRKTV